MRLSIILSYAIWFHFVVKILKRSSKRPRLSQTESRVQKSIINKLLIIADLNILWAKVVFLISIKHKIFYLNFIARMLGSRKGFKTVFSSI